MRLIEKCKCGGSIEVIFDHKPRSYERREDETGEARKQIDTFRRRHKECVARTSAPIYEPGSHARPAFSTLSGLGDKA